MEINEERELDLRSYLRVLTKRKGFIITIFCLILLIVTVQTFSETPIYRATARIVIEKENPNVVSIEEVMAVDSTGNDYYQTQYKIIESRAVARDVVQRLDLDTHPEFQPKDANDPVSRVKGWLRETVGFWKDRLISALNTGESADVPEAEAEGIDRVSDGGLVSALIRRIKVQPVRNSRLVDVSVEAADRELAARIANEVVDAYIDRSLETKLRAAKDAVSWLTERIEDERRKVETAENALLQYKEEQGIITGFSSDAENITAEKLAQLNNQVVEAESARVEAETRYRQATALDESPEMLDAIPEVLSNEIIQEIKKMEMTLYNRMSELSKKYGPKHPKMIAIQSELDELADRKITEAKRVVNSLRNEYRLALARERSLKQALAAQKQESLSMNKKAIQYGVLQRQAESSKHMYELLIKRFKETTLAEEMKTGNIRVIDQAEVPGSPVKPNKKRNLMLAAVLGLMAGIGFAFLLEHLDNTIKLPEEVKEYLDVPYLGPIPQFDTREGRMDGMLADMITVHSPKSTASESFRGIRTGLLFSSVENDPRVILVTSAEPAEGKTLCAANLAVTMAQSGSRVAIIDCDMRRPKMHTVFQIDRNTGVSNVMTGARDLSEVVYNNGIPNLSVVPCGPIPPNPSELLGSKRMAEFIEELKGSYERVIIDSPPLTAVTDSAVLAQVCDGVVMVVRAGVTTRHAVQNAVSQLKSLNVRILGALLNGVSTRRDSYYYQYYYYYYYGGDRENGKKKRQRGHSRPHAAA